MKKEKVLGIYGDKIKTESGMKTITGNLIPQIGESVYIDGDHIIGGNKRHGKTTPTINRQNEKVLIELAIDETKDVLVFRIVKIKNEICIVLKEYKGIKLQGIPAGYKTYDRFVYDKDNLCIYNENGICVKYKRNDKNVQRYKNDIFTGTIIVIAEYEADNLMMWTCGNENYGNYQIENDKDIMSYGTSNVIKKYKNHASIYEYNADYQMKEKLKSEFGKFLSELKSHATAIGAELRAASGGMGVFSINPSNKEIIARAGFSGNCQGDDGDFFIWSSNKMMYISNMHGTIKESVYKSETRHNQVVKEEGDRNYREIIYGKSNDFIEIKLNKNYIFLNPINEDYLINDIPLNKKFAIKDDRTGNTYWMHRFAKMFGITKDYLFFGSMLGKIFRVADIDENKMLIVSAQNNTMYIFNKKDCTLKKVAREGNKIINQQYLLIDYDKAKSLIDGFMMKL